MTHQKKYAIETIVECLNILNDSPVFYTESNGWEGDSLLNGIKIGTTNTAYRNELAMLVHLIFDMTQCTTELPTTIELH